VLYLVIERRLRLKPTAPHDAREGDAGGDYHSTDGTAQYPADDYVNDDVADAVCLRPEVIDDPAAQLHVRGESDEYAPGPPVTQSPEALSLPGASADTGFRSGREGVGWHTQGLPAPSELRQFLALIGSLSGSWA